MAHREQQQFCEKVRDKHRQHFIGTCVLEAGSRNINGTLRDLFVEPRLYIGVDVVPGPCVDLVGLFHEVELPDEPFDVVCSAEMLEHDPHAEKSVARMIQVLRPGGLFFLTMAGPNRAEHGTPRTSGPGETYGPEPDFYRRTTLEELKVWLGVANGIWADCVSQENKGSHSDLYFWGIKA